MCIFCVRLNYGYTWQHENDCQHDPRADQDDPEQSLQSDPTLLGDVLEAVQGSLGKVRLDMFGQREHCSNWPTCMDNIHNLNYL